MAKYVLSIDQGTTGTRAALFNENGELVGYAYREHRQIYPKPGWLEHDPLEIWENTRIVIREVLEKTKVNPRDIAAIGVTNQRETIVVWDPRNGRPLYNAIVWQCRRTAPLVEKLRKYRKTIYKKTGLVPDAYFSSTKIWWLLDNVPGLREKAVRGEALFGTIDTWIIWNLTRGSKNTPTPERGGAHVTDYSNASRTMIFNISKLDWDDELLEIQGKIPREALPLPLPSSYIYGYTGPDVSEKLFNNVSIPVAGDAGDQQAALFGQVGFREGDVKCTYGTGNFVLMNTGSKRVKSKHGLLTTIFYSLEKNKAVYAVEGSIFVTGAAVKWLRDSLKIIDTAAETEDLAKSLASNEGVYFVPAFVGLGTPYWDMYARGLIIGITGKTTRAHLARAVLEAIAYLTRDVIEVMKKDTGLEIKVLKVDGGASKNNFLMQFQADILGVRVIRPVILETTSLGAAYLAGLAVGVWKNLDEIIRLWRPEKEFTPRMSVEEREKLYSGWKQAVERALGWAKEVPWAYGLE
ncbi:glycerol kinase GlpK [Desulfurococcaceae archaeon MEX13E-LK6-19]|nr:glycerol kinase GlpK [Desulfurococcaceae archaeon MEX13E-LK6-19]